VTEWWLKTWLEKARQVTQAHFDIRGGRRWSIYEQLLHNHTEIDEAYEVIRRCDIDSCRDALIRAHLLEEICDIVYSALTSAHILDFTDDEILDSLLGTLRKIQSRVGITDMIRSTPSHDSR